MYYTEIELRPEKATRENIRKLLEEGKNIRIVYPCRTEELGTGIEKIRNIAEKYGTYYLCIGGTVYVDPSKTYAYIADSPRPPCVEAWGNVTRGEKCRVCTRVEIRNLENMIYASREDIVYTPEGEEKTGTYIEVPSRDRARLRLGKESIDILNDLARHLDKGEILVRRGEICFISYGTRMCTRADVDGEEGYLSMYDVGILKKSLKIHPDTGYVAYREGEKTSGVLVLENTRKNIKSMTAPRMV